jgi:hypothetical protein
LPSGEWSKRQRASTIYSGFSVDSEMCNHFVYAWPAGAISNGTIDGIPTFCAF